ncbi:ABC transporter permease [Pseudooceanicola algae]|uniref:Spermidine/putrescine transport system permease protein PotB n=1 Tax=Pseudooceanicola algae TaxID=1537215 RepID=A0A418SHX1_9RHOB|nr:ABC transporter permease [Pseudooceanicola algae]QPM90284.1 Spermidine/putrescine transport system permease protein PotB [Pseudooceanicola algae]
MSLARRKLLSLIALLGGPTLFLLVFFFCPLLIMVIYSFLEPGLYGGVVWNFFHLNYGRILGWADTRYEKFDPVFLMIFLRSIRLAGLTVLTSLLISYPAAFWIARMRPARRDFTIFLVTLPFFVSLIVRLFAWVLILRPTGFLNQGLMGLGLTRAPVEFLYTDFAVILGMTYVFIPFMFLPLYGAIEKLDMAQIEASADLGATRVQTFVKVILPATTPGILGGAIITFIPALGNFIVPSVLGGAKVLMIGNLIEQQFLSARNWPFGAALSMMVMAAVLVLLVLQLRLARARREVRT